MLASRLFSRSVNAALNARLVGKCHSSRLLSSHTARPPAAAAAASSSSSSNKKTLLASTLLIGGIVGLNYHMTNNPLLYEQDEGDRIIPSDNDDIVSYVQKKVIGRVYFGTILPAYNYVKESLFGDISETLWLPSNDRLLPDIPPDASYEPPVLVLDLEKTLVGCEYDAKYGWRYAKRPGLDKFLDTVTQYFEVVIFSETDAGTVQDIVEALDKDNRIYKLYSSHAEVSKDGVIIKRLEYLNRDVSKIIVIDDNTEQYNRYPQNTLLIKPFDDLSDTADSSLLDLLPVLLAICHEDVKDVRRVLDDLGTNSVEQAAEEYQMRVTRTKEAEYRRRNKGLGGFLRKVQNNSSAAPFAAIAAASTRTEEDDDSGRASLLSQYASPEALVEAPAAKGSAATVDKLLKRDKAVAKGPVSKKKGYLLERLEEGVGEYEAATSARRQKINELYMQRVFEKEKKRKAEEAAREG